VTSLFSDRSSTARDDVPAAQTSVRPPDPRLALASAALVALAAVLEVVALFPSQGSFDGRSFGALDATAGGIVFQSTY
jgi:hypothetical protein